MQMAQVADSTHLGAHGVVEVGDVAVVDVDVAPRHVDAVRVERENGNARRQQVQRLPVRQGSQARGRSFRVGVGRDALPDCTQAGALGGRVAAPALAGGQHALAAQHGLLHLHVDVDLDVADVAIQHVGEVEMELRRVVHAQVLDFEVGH